MESAWTPAASRPRPPFSPAPFALLAIAPLALAPLTFVFSRLDPRDSLPPFRPHDLHSIIHPPRPPPPQLPMNPQGIGWGVDIGARGGGGGQAAGGGRIGRANEGYCRMFTMSN